MKAFIFDTETTGLVTNRKLKLKSQPHIIEFYGCLVDLKKGKVLSEINQLIKPPDPFLVTEEITRITGLKYEDLKDAPPFEDVAEKIITALEKAPVLIAHNLSFDKEMIEIEADRCWDQKIKWPKRLLCTVEQTIHIKGFRLNLSGLHEHLFGEKFEGAHRAKVDVEALTRCCVKLVKMGVL